MAQDDGIDPIGKHHKVGDPFAPPGAHRPGVPHHKPTNIPPHPEIADMWEIDPTEIHPEMYHVPGPERVPPEITEMVDVGPPVEIHPEMPDIPDVAEIYPEIVDVDPAPLEGGWPPPEIHPPPTPEMIYFDPLLEIFAEAEPRPVKPPGVDIAEAGPPAEIYPPRPPPHPEIHS